jgi:hypothetical protein
VAAASDRDAEAGQGGLELAQRRRCHAFGRLGVDAGGHDHELALAAQPARLHEGGQRRALDRAGTALGSHEYSRPPVTLLGLLRSSADHERACAAAEVTAELAGSGHDVLAIGDPASEQVLEEVAHGGLAGAFRRLGPIDLERDQIAHQPQQGGRRGIAAGPVAQLADG